MAICSREKLDDVTMKLTSVNPINDLYTVSLFPTKENERSGYLNCFIQQDIHG